MAAKYPQSVRKVPAKYPQSCSRGGQRRQDPVFVTEAEVKPQTMARAAGFGDARRPGEGERRGSGEGRYKERERKNGKQYMCERGRTNERARKRERQLEQNSDRRGRGREG